MDDIIIKTLTKKGFSKDSIDNTLKQINLIKNNPPLQMYFALHKIGFTEDEINEVLLYYSLEKINVITDPKDRNSLFREILVGKGHNTPINKLYDLFLLVDKFFIDKNIPISKRTEYLNLMANSAVALDKELPLEIYRYITKN